MSNFPAILWREQTNFQWDDDEARFVLDQRAELDFHSASSMKQQSADRHVASLGHIIRISSQFQYLLFLLNAAHLAEKQQILLLKSLVWPDRGSNHRHLFHSKNIRSSSSSLLQGKHLPLSSSPLRLNIFRLFVILSLTQLYRYTRKIFLFSTATFKYTYRAPLRRIRQEYSANVAFSTFKSLKRI